MHDVHQKVPMPMKPWPGIKDCSRPAPKCIQPRRVFPSNVSAVHQEDCLYLNVFVPNVSKSTICTERWSLRKIHKSNQVHIFFDVGLV